MFQKATSNEATVSISVESSPPNQGDGPSIDLWYGTNQTFGQIGQPQTWVNILGNVDDPDGVSSLTYSLNGGAEIPLTIDAGFRLNKNGDFNADIAYADLDGSVADDSVIFTATDELGNVSTETVTINYESGNVWPQNYSIDWDNTVDITGVSQVVDGLWSIEGDSVRTTEPGYDRLLAIGDISWEDYEVTVPITLNDSIANTGAVGVMMRWQGHTDNNLSGQQPLAGFTPYGALGWIQRGNRLQIDTEKNSIRDDSRTFQPDTTYNLKMRVETTDTTDSLYSLKVWELGQSEPLDWDLQQNEGLSGPGLQNGSLLLVAHRQDASFGDVNITPL